MNDLILIDVLDLIDKSSDLAEIKGMVKVLKLQLESQVDRTAPIIINFTPNSDKRINVVKEIRQVLQNTLLEAKNMMESGVVRVEHTKITQATDLLQALKPICSNIQLVNAPKAMKVLF